MLRRCLAAAVVMLVVGGFVAAETLRGIVTSLKDDEIKITVRKKGEKEGEAKTFKVAKDVKITAKAKGGEAKELTVEKAAKLVEKMAESKLKGAPASIDVEDGKVTKITFGGGRGKKGGGGDK
jgi:hypothetical protein